MSKKFTGSSIAVCQQEDPKRPRGRPRKDIDIVSLEKKMSDIKIKNSNHGSSVKRPLSIDTKLKKNKQITKAPVVMKDTIISDVCKTRSSSRSQFKDMNSTYGDADAGTNKLSAEDRHSNISRASRTFDDEEGTEETIHSDKERIGEKKSDDIEEMESVDKFFPEETSKSQPDESMDSVDETDSSAEFEENENIATSEEADNVDNPGSSVNSPSLSFVQGFDEIHYDDEEEGVRTWANNFEERVNIVNDDWDTSFVDESLYNDGPIDETTNPRVLVEGMTANDVLEEDEEEIIVLMYGETPENRPPICKRKKPNGMEEDSHEATESHTFVPSRRRCNRNTKKKQIITGYEDREENELELNEYISESDMLHMEKGLTMKNGMSPATYDQDYESEDDFDQPGPSSAITRRMSQRNYSREIK